MSRTEDSFQAPNNGIIEEDEDEGWLCASNPPFVEPFTGTSEVTIDLSDDPTPSKFFKFFFTGVIIQDWVHQTNLYVLSKMDVTHELPEHPRLGSWREVTLDEMKVFLRLLINTGLVRKDTHQGAYRNQLIRKLLKPTIKPCIFLQNHHRK